MVVVSCRHVFADVLVAVVARRRHPRALGTLILLHLIFKVLTRLLDDTAEYLFSFLVFSLEELAGGLLLLSEYLLGEIVKPLQVGGVVVLL